MRTRTSTSWGWNSSTAAMVKAPSLLIAGEFDFPQRRIDLFEDLGSRHKVLIKVACGSHFLVWENQHKILLETSKEWFRKGSIEGVRLGTFWVDAEGRIFPQ